MTNIEAMSESDLVALHKHLSYHVQRYSDEHETGRLYAAALGKIDAEIHNRLRLLSRPATSHQIKGHIEAAQMQLVLERVRRKE